jgi:hypothetical protein
MDEPRAKRDTDEPENEVGVRAAFATALMFGSPLLATLAFGLILILNPDARWPVLAFPFLGVPVALGSGAGAAMRTPGRPSRRQAAAVMAGFVGAAVYMLLGVLTFIAVSLCLLLARHL